MDVDMINKTEIHLSSISATTREWWLNKIFDIP